MTAELGLQNGEMTTLFRQSLGLDCSEAATKLLAFVRNTPELPVEYISPVLLGEHGIHSEAECEAALRFLETIGCIDIGQDMVKPDPVVDRVMPRDARATSL